MEIPVTRKIYSEFEEMKKFSDDDGAAAEEILGSVSMITVVETRSKPTGEEELIVSVPIFSTISRGRALFQKMIA